MNSLCSAILLSTIVLVSSFDPHRAYSQGDSDPPSLAFQEPYSDRGPIQQRISEHSRPSMLPHWLKTSYSKISSEASNEIVASRERDVLIKLLRLSESELQEIDNAFAARSKERDENTHALSKLSMQEQILHLSIQRDETPRIDISEFASVSAKDVQKLFDQSAEAEAKSEERLVAKLNETLDPIQKETLFVRWIRLDTLDSLFSRSYLDLSDEQSRAIGTASRDFKKLQWKLEQDYKASKETTNKPPKHSVGQTVVRSHDWHRARLTIASHLTPAQFRKCQHLFHGDLKLLKLNFEDLLEKTEELALSDSEASFIGEIELELLSPLYIEGIRLEREEKKKQKPAS